MSPSARTVRDYVVMAVGTLVALELASFAILVWRTASTDHVGLAQAASVRLHQHPFLDRSIPNVKKNSEYVYLPTTQHAFKSDATFSELRVGRHGFILNGKDEAADYPDKPPGLVRIVMLGGSSTAGATASGNDKTIAAQLEGLLDASGAGRYQVLNFGMGGNYSYGELTQLISVVAYLSPDAVILFDGYNDAYYAGFQHLREELDAPLMNFADYSYQYFDTMAGLRAALRSPPPVMTYAYLLVAEALGRAGGGSVRAQRQALYAGLAARELSDWVAKRDPGFRTVMKTNLDVEAAWAARNRVHLFGYLQPHPWEFKDLSCERGKGAALVFKTVGVSDERYIEVMRSAFQGYGQVYQELAAAYADTPFVHFTDLRRMFEDVHECMFNDSIHYTDDGNLRLAKRMQADLMAAGVGRPRG